MISAGIHLLREDRAGNSGRSPRSDCGRHVRRPGARPNIFFISPVEGGRFLPAFISFARIAPEITAAVASRTAALHAAFRPSKTPRRPRMNPWLFSHLFYIQSSAIYAWSAAVREATAAVTSGVRKQGPISPSFRLSREEDSCRDSSPSRGSRRKLRPQSLRVLPRSMLLFDLLKLQGGLA